MKKQTAYFLLRDRRKHQRIEQGVSKGSAAPGAEMPAVGAGCLSGVSLPRHTACPGRSAPAGQQQQQLAQPGLALGAGGRRAGTPLMGEGQAQPWAGWAGALQAVAREPQEGASCIPHLLSCVPVGCSLSPATTAGLLRPRSCRDSGGVKPRRGSVAGDRARCRADAGAAGAGQLKATGTSRRAPGAAEPCPSRVPRAGTGAGAEGHRQGSAEPRGKHQPEPAQPQPGPAPLWNTWAHQHSEGAPSCSADPQLPVLSTGKTKQGARSIR